MMKQESNQQNNKPETKRSYKKVLTIGISKLRYFIIVIGAVLASIAPFVHILFPTNSDAIIVLEQQLEENVITKVEYEQTLPILEKEQKFCGFRTTRNFLASIGPFLTIFLMAISMLLSIPYIHQYNIKKGITIASILLLGMTLYSIVYIIFPKSDLPEGVYHALMILGGFEASFIAYHFIVNQKRIDNYLPVIWKLTDFIVINVQEKFVRKEQELEYIEEVEQLNDSL